jgi:hypothetical protein
LAVSGYIWVKEGAVVLGLQKPMAKAKALAATIYWAHGEEFFITSGIEGNHSDGSLHPFGYAIDFKPPKTNKDKIHKELIKAFSGEPYDIVLHGKPIHYHLEFDPK